LTREYKLAVIGGDGIGPEVTAYALQALEVATRGSGLTFATTEYDLGAPRFHATGETLTDADLASLKEHDAILLGAIGDPQVPSGVLERGLLLKLRFAFNHYINLRPTKLFPGVTSPLANPGKVDFVVVREGTEGPVSYTHLRAHETG
jgi:3-isopropylmalate dehydrogenase